MVLELLADPLELVVDGRHVGRHLGDLRRRSGCRRRRPRPGRWSGTRRRARSSPVFGSRVNATPVPESSPMLPKTIVTTLTAVPRSSAILLNFAVVAGALAEPAREHGLDREVELLVRVRRELAPGVLADDRLELVDERAEVGGAQVRVLLRAARVLLRLERRRRTAPPSTSMTIRPNIWMNRRYASHPNRSLPVSAISPCERLLVQAEVEDGVHHPGHRELGAGADADEERVRRRRRSPCRPAARPPCTASRTSSQSPSGSRSPAAK